MAGPTQSHQVVLYRVGHFLLSTGVLPIIPSSGTLQDSTSALVDFAPHCTANEPPIIPSSGTLQWRPIRLTPRTRLIIMVVVKPHLIRTHSSRATQIPSSGTLQGGPVQPNPIKWYFSLPWYLSNQVVQSHPRYFPSVVPFPSSGTIPSEVQTPFSN